MCWFTVLRPPPAPPVPYQGAATARHRRGEYKVEEEEGGQSVAKSPTVSYGPVYTYVKTDKHGHYKWGVRHAVTYHH
ncbi:hypothetical protein J437_LFUL014570 [Ladona fulva]|uniref:Uncharacterized protein n=1 Tax=Ladona fulva TaxID=123851 RepID=A0A8K0KIE2_LADFU|nr:hypothetical protein J437_LFUL014570 [Ladona fulva]